MKLLNNNFFIIFIVVLVVTGLLTAVQFATPSTTVQVKDYGSENPQYNDIRGEIDNMKKWDKTTYYRIKNTIQDYKNTDQIDKEMQLELGELLKSKYLLQLAAVIKNFCASGSSMTQWKELTNEAKKFKENIDFSPNLNLLEQYRYVRTIAQTAIQYGKNEQYEVQKSTTYETILNSFPTKVGIKNNTTIQQEAKLGLQALGLVQGLDRRYKATDLKTCDCEDRFGKNKYYKEACETTQQTIE